MDHDITVTVLEGGFLSVDYQKLLERLAILLLTDLSNAETGFRITATPQPRAGGPLHQLQIVADGDRVLFACEGDSEERLALSLWAAICSKFAMSERVGLFSQQQSETMN